MPAAATITITATMTTIFIDPCVVVDEAMGRSIYAAESALTPPSLLRLMAWLSPAFPTGAFAYSHGQEWAVESRDITNETNLTDWLTDLLTEGTARTDTILLRHAHRSAADPPALKRIADLAYATASAKERQAESLDQGKAFMLAATPWGIPPAPERIRIPSRSAPLPGLTKFPKTLPLRPTSRRSSPT